VAKPAKKDEKKEEVAKTSKDESSSAQPKK